MMLRTANVFLYFSLQDANPLLYIVSKQISMTLLYQGTNSVSVVSAIFVLGK